VLQSSQVLEDSAMRGSSSCQPLKSFIACDDVGVVYGSVVMTVSKWHSGFQCS